MVSRVAEAEDLLMAAVAAGDRRAFAELYDTLAPAVYGLSRRVMRDDALAEEVSQETFVELWRTAPRFDPTRAPVRTWALTIAHRRAVDRVRSEQSSRARLERVGARQAIPSDTVSETVIDNAEREQVGRALAVLSPLQRQAIELAYYGGHTYGEVAQILDTPVGTIKTRIRDGLGRLRDTLTRQA